MTHLSVSRHIPYVFPPSVNGMTTILRTKAKRKLLRRAAGVETVSFYTDLDPTVDTEIKRLVDEFRIPQWAVIEQAIKNIQFDEHGKPLGWSIPEPGAEELPIADVA